MEDYEKKYKDALEMAEEIIRYYKEHNRSNETSIEDLEQIFPELKKSKNERIKKRILLSLEKDLMATKNSGCDTQDLEQCIAWLEKQGKQKTAVVDFNAKDWYVSKVDGKIHDMTYNPADKVEPKFKVGDILVRKKGKGFLYPVIDMDDKYYVIRAFYKPFAIEKKECEEFFKLVRRRENGKLIE